VLYDRRDICRRFAADTAPRVKAAFGEQLASLFAAYYKPEGKPMPKGFIKSFNVDKGYGFIKLQDGSEDVFVHIKELRRIGVSTLRDGQIVKYISSRIGEGWRQVI
jgi:CspA family cold shock protein